MTPIEIEEKELAAEIDAASMDIHRALEPHKFTIALFSLLMNLAVLLERIDEMNPAPEAFVCYAGLQTEIELFLEYGGRSLLAHRARRRAQEKRERPN